MNRRRPLLWCGRFIANRNWNAMSLLSPGVSDTGPVDQRGTSVARLCTRNVSRTQMRSPTSPNGHVNQISPPRSQSSAHGHSEPSSRSAISVNRVCFHLIGRRVCVLRPDKIAFTISALKIIPRSLTWLPPDVAGLPILRSPSQHTHRIGHQPLVVSHWLNPLSPTKSCVSRRELLIQVYRGIRD